MIKLRDVVEKILDRRPIMSREDIYIDEETILQVSDAGYAILWNHESDYYISRNMVIDFQFRGRTESAELDGTDFWGLKENELDNIFARFNFKRGE